MTALGWSPGNPFAPSEPAEIVVFVAGRPAPQGSKDYKGRRKNGSAILVESSRHLKPWREVIVDAMKADGRRVPGPVTVATWFVIRRPKVIKNAMTGLSKRDSGDGDKLTRAVWDALVIAKTIDDDDRVLDWYGSKRVAEAGEQTGVLVVIRPYVPRRSPLGFPALP